MPQFVLHLGLHESRNSVNSSVQGVQALADIDKKKNRSKMDLEKVDRRMEKRPEGCSSGASCATLLLAV
jgi:hypothetical protein